MVTINRSKLTILRTYLINFVVVLMLTSSASAFDCEWYDGTGFWDDSYYWYGGVPDITKSAAINDEEDANCLIDSSVTATCSSLDVGYDTGPCCLNMTGGTLTSNGYLYVGNEPSPGDADTNGVFIISGGDVNIGGKLLIGEGKSESSEEPVYGTFIMYGGDVNVNGTKIELGKNLTGKGWIYINGGTLNLMEPTKSGDFEFGTYGTATLVMTAGELNIFDKLRLSPGGSENPAGTATIYMDGGRITCNDLMMDDGTPKIYLNSGDFNCSDQISMVSANALIDISEGTLLIPNEDYLDEIYDYISANKIIGYGGDAGYVVVTEEGGGIGYSTVTAKRNDPNLAWKPSPGNYTTVEWTPAGPTLSWRPGRYAAKHDVYFGTDWDDVNDANRTDPCGVLISQNQIPTTCAFPVPPPELDKTYYWRVDEINDTCAPNIWKGIVWQFTMADYEEVEDFDSYASDATLQAVWALTGVDSTISRESTIRRSGNSMKYEYSHSGATEASANTTGANKLPVDINDWTTADIKALTLYFYGDVSNSSTEKMYVALKSTDNNLAVVYYDTPSDLNKPEWHEWNIELSDFTGVNLHSINKIYVGFGNRGSPPASDGTVYFDDIRLYPRRCVASHRPDGDIDGDCIIDFVDVNLMASDWLDADATRKGSDGELKGGALWVTDGARHCVQLDGTNDWIDLDDSDFSDFRNKTIAMWVKIMYYSSSYPYIFYFNNDDDENPYRIYIQTYTPTSYFVRARFGGNGMPKDGYSESKPAGEGVWRHLALVIKDVCDGTCTGEFYFDGVMVAATPMPGRPRHYGEAVGVNLGSANDGSGSFVKAVFDDFRVYDKALTFTEVGNLYSGVEPVANMLLHYDFNEVSGLTAHNSSTYEFYHPLLSDAEIYKYEVEGHRVVNLKDFAILADSWLEEKLWP
jgi:hypothetical protein